jgi:hypothetical protein
VGHLVPVTAVWDPRCQPVDQAKPLVGPGQQDDTAIQADRSSVEAGGDFPAAETWQ